MVSCSRHVPLNLKKKRDSTATILCSTVLKNKNYENVARKLERRNTVTYIQRKKESDARKFYSQQENAYTECKYNTLIFSDKIENYPKNLIFFFVDHNFVFVDLLKFI